MILMGDEVQRSQNGSNNAFTMPVNMRVDIEDSPATFMGGWALAWQYSDMQKDMHAAVIELIKIRKTYLTDIAAEFFTGRIDLGTQRKDIAWFRSDGLELNDDNWHERDRMQLAIFFEAKEEQGLLLLLNGSRDEVSFKLPDRQWGDSYRSIFDSTHPVAQYEPQLRSPDESTTLSSHSVQVWLVHHITVA